VDGSEAYDAYTGPQTFVRNLDAWQFDQAEPAGQRPSDCGNTSRLPRSPHTDVSSMDFVILILVISAGGSLAWCALTGFSAFRTASQLEGRAGHTERLRRLKLKGTATHPREVDGAPLAQRRSALMQSIHGNPASQQHNNPASPESHADQSRIEYDEGLQR